MDRSRDVRRGGASRFSSANGQKNIKQSENMKKERIRRLSVVSRLNSINEDDAMGSAAAGSGGEDELRSIASITKRFKLPRKLFYDCNTVDHSSVPRKLRSAMKKRNRESVSPPLPDKTNHRINGDDLSRKDDIKKSRLNRQGGDYPPITKDEEEVVETLNALADMFPNSNKENGSNGEITKAIYRPLLEGESLKSAFEAPEKKEDSVSLRLPDAASLLEGGSAQETVEVKCPNGSSHHGFPKSIELGNVEAISQSELCLRTGSEQQPKHEETAACARKLEIEAAAVSDQHELQDILKESTNAATSLEIGSAWADPGLCSAEPSSSVGSPRRSLMPSRDVIPTWLAKAASAPGSLDNSPCTKKDSRGPVARKRPWKRCSAHVHISRLIKALQIAEKTNRLPTQLTSNEEPKQGVCSTAENLNGSRKGLYGTVSARGIVTSAAEQSPHEVRNGSLLHNGLFLDQQQASATSPLYTSQKQSFDFLSLSAGVGGFEAPNSSSKQGNGLEPLTQFHIPYPFMPFSASENWFSSAPSTFHLPGDAAKQVRIQPLPYVRSPLLGYPHLGNTASPKQQQRWIWAAQQAAAQQNPVGSHIPNWQNGRQEYPPSAIQYAQCQSIPSPSYASLEVLGPKYAPISEQQQQQQFVAVTSSPLPVARSKRQQHHYLPSGYNMNGVGSYADAARPLQLLCNEHL